MHVIVLALFWHRTVRFQSVRRFLLLDFGFQFAVDLLVQLSDPRKIACADRLQQTSDDTAENKSRVLLRRIGRIEVGLSGADCRPNDLVFDAAEDGIVLQRCVRLFLIVVE